MKKDSEQKCYSNYLYSFILLQKLAHAVLARDYITAKKVCESNSSVKIDFKNLVYMPYSLTIASYIEFILRYDIDNILYTIG